MLATGGGEAPEFRPTRLSQRDDSLPLLLLPVRVRFMLPRGRGRAADADVRGAPVLSLACCGEAFLNPLAAAADPGLVPSGGLCTRTLRAALHALRARPGVQAGGAVLLAMPTSGLVATVGGAPPQEAASAPELGVLELLQSGEALGARPTSRATRVLFLAARALKRHRAMQDLGERSKI